MPVIVVAVPDPFVVIPPGDLVTVHDTDDGKPLKATLPVDTAQVGCVIVPTTGAVGVDGCASITILPLEVEVQLELLVTVYE
jgi:hypothetical protein